MLRSTMSSKGVEWRLFSCDEAQESQSYYYTKNNNGSSDGQFIQTQVFQYPPYCILGIKLVAFTFYLYFWMLLPYRAMIHHHYYEHYSYVIKLLWCWYKSLGIMLSNFFSSLYFYCFFHLLAPSPLQYSIGKKRLNFFSLFQHSSKSSFRKKKSKPIRGDTKSRIDDLSQQEVDSKT